MQLSPHFTLEEFTRSSTATRLGIDNRLDSSVAENQSIVHNLENLCIHVLEPLRERTGERVFISSGYRCPALNKAVGGSASSQHMTGEACDIYLPDFEKLNSWFIFLKEGEFDQLILERSGSLTWIHVSYCQTGNRHKAFFLSAIGYRKDDTWTQKNNRLKKKTPTG